MSIQPERARIFSLNEARALLPQVKALTADAVRRVEALKSQSDVENAVREWAEALHELGVETKGLWLVDFDNGQGYYCWCYPEETISHFHDYDAGFRGRMKIV